MSRAFKSIDNQITTGGDYIEALRRKTMYMSIMRKAKTVEQTSEYWGVGKLTPDAANPAIN